MLPHLAIVAPRSGDTLELFSIKFFSRSPRPDVGPGPSRSLGNRLLLALVPVVALITAGTGYVGYRISLNFLNTALERNVRILNLAMAHAVENLLEQARRDLAMIAQEPGMDSARMRDFLFRARASGGICYKEMAFISASEDASQFVVASSCQTADVLGEGMQDIQPNPFLLLERGDGLAPGETLVTPVTAVEHPFPVEGQANRRLSSHVIRLVTPYSPNGRDQGLLVLGLDAKDVRNVLSRYNSPASPLWAFPRSDEVRYAYLFDPEGWILFQSEDADAPDTPLGAHLARSGYEGSLGRAGMPGAFRPNSGYGAFWKSVTALAAGEASFQIVKSGSDASSRVNSAFFAQAPVRFSPGAGKPARIYAGVAFVDRSLLTVAAGYRHLDALFLLFLGAALLLSLVVFVLAKLTTAPILRLAEEAQSLHEGNIRPMETRPSGYESKVLRDALNHLIEIMEHQAEEVRCKDATLRAMAMREKATLAPWGLEAPAPGSTLSEISGIGPRMDKLRRDILKAAQAGVDVLILGETGAGKQLAAEAIHRQGPRAEGPFIAINCGALDENLLLDTLFGHVRGAFTEARADRKGAFQEARGGTLFLDEIQTSSPKVQQSLLRAIEARRFRPLGSDREVEVDLRLVAATNVNLAEAAARGEFREDLYFRLRVVSIFTPALREHPESIPQLAGRFLADAEKMAGKTGMGFTRGALKKLAGHPWPGNIRELKNCITMAAVMAEGHLIHPGDLHLGAEETAWSEPQPEALAPPGAEPRPDPRGQPAPSPPRERPVRTPPSARSVLRKPVAAPSGLNSRQSAAWPAIAAAGEITRSRYQEEVGGGLPSRTAIHDIQDMVKRGLLVKADRGPSTRYLLVKERKEPRSFFTIPTSPLDFP